MGCGKTTAGRLTAAALGVPFVDNDATIAQMAGTSTVDLAGLGGGVLHDWERRYAEAQAAAGVPSVVGVPASCADRPADLAALRAAGTLVYLRARPEVLAARVLADAPRPWLTRDPAEVTALVRDLHERRDAVMATAAHRVVDAERSSLDVAAALVDALRVQHTA
jgi:shikimate kinase